MQSTYKGNGAGLGISIQSGTQALVVETFLFEKKCESVCMSTVKVFHSHGEQLCLSPYKAFVCGMVLRRLAFENTWNCRVALKVLVILL